MEKLREASSLHASDFATAWRWIWSSLYGVADLATKRLFRYSAEQLFWKHMPVVPRRPISWPTRKQSTLSRAIGFGSRMNSRTFGRCLEVLRCTRAVRADHPDLRPARYSRQQCWRLP